MNFTPMNDKVLVRIAEAPSMVGGIHIPQANYSMRAVSQIVDEATVVAVGPKVRDIKVNDCVLTPAREGMPVKIDGARHVLFKESEIMAITGRVF